MAEARGKRRYEHVERKVAKRERRDQYAEQSDAWQLFGCAVCGQTARRDADPGWRIELHHTTNRSQGGHDSPLLGLCGELLDNKCHWRVTTGRLKLDHADVGWVWTDTRTGDSGLCRVLSMELAVQTGLDRVLTTPIDGLKARAWVRREVPQERVEAVARGTGLDALDLSSPGIRGAESRFNAARDLNYAAQRAWMALAVVIQKAFAMDDPSKLGFETQEQWADAVGVDASTMSKLRLIGVEFAGSWETLPAVDRQNLSMEGLYLAARMVKLGHWDEQTALSEAVAQPVHKLYRTYRETVETGLVPNTVESHECPLCGRWHPMVVAPNPRGVEALREWRAKRWLEKTNDREEPV